MANPCETCPSFETCQTGYDKEAENTLKLTFLMIEAFTELNPSVANETAVGLAGVQAENIARKMRVQGCGHPEETILDAMQESALSILGIEATSSAGQKIVEIYQGEQV